MIMKSTEMPMQIRLGIGRLCKGLDLPVLRRFSSPHSGEAGAYSSTEVPTLGCQTELATRSA